MYAFEMNLAEQAFDKAMAVAARAKADDAANRAASQLESHMAAFAASLPANAKEAAARLSYVLQSIQADDESRLGAMASLINESRRELLKAKSAPYLARRLRAIAEIASDYDGDTFLVRILATVAKGMARPVAVN